MTGELDNLKTEVAASVATTTEAVTELRDLKAKVADLAAQLAASATDPAAVTALAQQLHDATAALAAEETPAAPAEPTA